MRDQSVASQVRRGRVHGGDGGLEPVRAGRADALRPGQLGLALGDAAAVPAGPVLVLQQDQLALGAEAGAAAAVLQQHEGEQARGPRARRGAAPPAAGRGGCPRRTARGGSGRRARWPRSPRRRRGRRTPAPPAAARPAGRPGGTRNGMLVARILAFARLRRWATVASGCRKARAISSVRRPHTSRSVSATWAAGARAGWQQVNIIRSWSSSTGTTSSSVAAVAPARRRRGARRPEGQRPAPRRPPGRAPRLVAGPGRAPGCGRWS